MISNEHLPTNIAIPRKSHLEFAERIRKHFDNAPPIVFESLPQDDPKRRCPTSQKQSAS